MAGQSCGKVDAPHSGGVMGAPRARRKATPFDNARTSKKIPARLREPLARPVAPRSTAARLGDQVRALRMARGFSASALATASKVSRSMLSRIERGQASPSIEALERIALALDVPMSRFFVDQIKRTDCSYVPAGKGVQIDREGVIRGYRYELVGHLLSGNMFVEPYRVSLMRDAEPYTSFQHPGVKLIHMLTGRVRYQYGAREIDLKPGDTLLFDATALHGSAAIVERPVEYLSIVFTLRD